MNQKLEYYIDDKVLFQVAEKGDRKTKLTRTIKQKVTRTGVMQ